MGNPTNIKPAAQPKNITIGIDPARPKIIFMARLRGFDKSKGINDLSEWDEERTYYPSGPTDTPRVKELMVKGWVPLRLENFDTWPQNAEDKLAWKEMELDLTNAVELGKAKAEINELKRQAEEAGAGKSNVPPEGVARKVRAATDAKGA